MHLKAVSRILGVLLMAFSLTMLPPAGVSLYYRDGTWLPFVQGFVVILLSGFAVYVASGKDKPALRLRDGFLIVAMFWVVLSAAAAIPLLVAGRPDLSTTDAVFEAVSGLTTTGATILINLDTLPRSILYYRQQLQWLGGMGIIVLAVAVLPMLGVGGMQLYRAETPGPVKDNKLSPRIAQTAKWLWLVYLGMTVSCGMAYWLAGMDPFDAIGHAFSTVAIGGFSTHDASLGYFSLIGLEGAWIIELVAVFFMFAAGANFALHFAAFYPLSRWQRPSFRLYLQDSEFRAYTLGLAALTIFVIARLIHNGQYEDVWEAILKGLFQAVSIATTTGFTTEDYSAWPGALPVLLILASFVGGCAGSTGGGMKVIRWLLIYKQGRREVIKLVHPSAEIPVKLGDKAVPSRVTEAVWGFFSIYVLLFGFMMVLLMATGLDQVTAFAAVTATLNNLGPGLGDVTANFREINDTAKWVGVAAMLLH
jgi:trk system potassium uptake protein TrkH